VDLNTAAVLLARESGYMRTTVARDKLNISITELLRLRRQLILSGLGVQTLPGMAGTKDEPSTNPQPEGRKAC
jgi:hypothetical protein